MGVLDKAVTLPDDDLSNSPPYMELSDDEDDSNCSASCGEIRVPERTVSGPILSRHSVHSRSNGSSRNSPSCEDIDSASQMEGSKGQEGEESVTVVTKKESRISDRDHAINGG